MIRALRLVVFVAAVVSTGCAADGEGTPARTVTATRPTLPTVTVPEESRTEQAETEAEPGTETETAEAAPPIATDEAPAEGPPATVTVTTPAETVTVPAETVTLPQETVTVAPETVTETVSETVTETQMVTETDEEAVSAAVAAAAAAASDADDAEQKAKWGWIAFGLTLLAAAVVGLVLWLRSRRRPA